MKSKNDFFKDGFLFGRLDEYDTIFDYSMMTSIKEVVNSINVYKSSRYIYEYQYMDRKINRELNYDDVKRNIAKDTSPSNELPDDITEHIYKQLHLSSVSMIDYKGAWILGEVCNDSYHIYMDDIHLQQTRFTNYYFDEYQNSKHKDFSLGNTLVQFYDEGCMIGPHDDGAPTNRVATFLYFLNETWDEKNGGQLVINPNTQNQVVVEPIFPNFVVLDQSENCVNNIHEVRKVKDNIKLTLTSFFELS